MGDEVGYLCTYVGGKQDYLWLWKIHQNIQTVA